MLTTMTDFFRVLPAKHCSNCNEELIEMADCYKTVCEKCDGAVYYPISPLSAKVIPYTSGIHQ